MGLSPRVRIAASSLALVSLFAASFATARVGGPVLHEYFEPSAKEDLALGATIAHGRIPAAIDTPNGPVEAPNPLRDPYASTTVYGGEEGQRGRDGGFKIDRVTSRPQSVDYHEPFIPSIAPFKRLRAFDAVTGALELVVYDTRLQPLPIEPTPRAGEDLFYADLAVELVANEPVRIPSVGPSARVLAVSLMPSTPFELLRDGADNWFIRGRSSARVRVTMQLAVDRRVFGDKFSATPRSELARHVPPVPKPARVAAARVSHRLGLPDGQEPAETVAALVRYFRSFTPSSEPPAARFGADLYAELVLSRKGVCRHRAYAFVVTALALGIPARLVLNEAHAWVEVFDGTLWHRIDLGGAASQMNLRQENRFEPYREPRDPYEWPDRGGSGRELAERASRHPESGTERREAAGRRGGTSPGGTSSAVPPPASDGLALNVAPGLAAERLSARVPAELTVAVASQRVTRGESVRVRGQLGSEEGSCAHARIDISLQPAQGESLFVQSVAADAAGRFAADVTIPVTIPVGDYSFVVRTPGTLTCAPTEAH